MLVVGLFQVLVPLILIAVLAFGQQPSRWRWALMTVAFGMVIAYTSLTSRWDISSIYLRTLYPLLFAGGAVVGFRRIKVPEKAPGVAATVVAVVTSVGLIVLMSGMNWFSFRGLVQPADAIDVAPPLRGMKIVAVHGGASPFTNAHYHVRPQNHALDLVALNALGARADVSGSAADLNSYEVFGATIYSPCAGIVTAVVDEYPDLVPPATDPEHPAGNHVLVACDDAELLLAHMKQGSVRVSVGDAVTTDTRLGQVGNTGNTSEPHLHIHAERGGEPGVALDGQAVPITIDGEWLVRGSVMTIPPATESEAVGRLP